MQDNRGRTVEDFGPVLVQMGQAPANLAQRARQTAETLLAGAQASVAVRSRSCHK